MSSNEKRILVDYAPVIPVVIGCGPDFNNIILCKVCPPERANSCQVSGASVVHRHPRPGPEIAGR